MKTLVLLFVFFNTFIFSVKPVFGGTCVGVTCPTDEYCRLDRNANPICIPNPPAAGGGGAGSGTGTCTPIGFSGTGVETALGCIPTDPQELVKWVLKFAILMGGGIAFLLSVFGGVSIILAGGNPEKINAAKEIIGSALTGLLFIIFSVFLLRFIGYDILQLPGFSNP